MNKLSHETGCEELIRQEIDRRGPLSFSEFMELALYHPLYGYYNQKSPVRGRAGDYFTSLQVSELFPRIFADVVMDMRETLGAEQFALIEMGAGGGEFLVGVLKALSDKAELKGLRVWAVEKSRPARDGLWRKLSRFARCEVVGSVEEVEWMGGVEGCVFSNELVDALPFRRFRFSRKTFQEIFVDIKDGQFAQTEKPLTDQRILSENGLDRLPWEEGQEIELRFQVDSLYESWDALFHRGYVVTMDYGYPRATLYDPLRKQGTWLCYHKHEVNQDIFNRIGRQDITAHVDFTQLAEAGSRHGFDPLLFASQGIFLSHAGKNQIERFLHEEANPLKKKGVLQQLLHPSAMGEKFWVLLQAKGLPLPKSFESIPNRLHRLPTRSGSKE